MNGWFKLLLRPMVRVATFRRDDRAQVMVLTVVMIFVVMIMALTTLNTSTAIYNRMRVQNAADAAADAFAVWQARGLNVVQHLNDLHYTANWVLYVGETVGCGARILCGALRLLDFTPCACGSTCHACCIPATLICVGSEQVQHYLSIAILAIQEFMNYAAPISGFIAADKLAEANGADPVLDVVGALADDILGIFGLSGGIGDFTSALGDIIDVHIIPLNLDDRALTLNIYEKDPKPDSAPWFLDEDIMDPIVQAGDISCRVCATGSSTYDIHDRDADGWGWEDTFYCGYPSYNTWLAGKRRWDILGGLRKNAWLNPNRGATPPEEDVFWYEDNYGNFREPPYTPDGDDALNPPFFALASSQVQGSPVIERSGHDDFEAYSTPHLISVHLGSDSPSDDVTSALFIWH